MALDNKNLGDKLYAFETNGILKAIRTLFSNLLDLSSRPDGILISSLNNTNHGDNVVPVGTKKIICTFYGWYVNEGSSRPVIGEVELNYGKTTGYVRCSGYQQNIGALFSVNWATRILTTSSSGEQATSGLSMTFYFYS